MWSNESLLLQTDHSCNGYPSWIGYVAVPVAILFFGSNFIPVKKVDTGDGMFFQWVVCCAVWIVGLIVNAITGFKEFVPLAMLGGFLWATGNVFVVVIIKTIGLGVGMLIYSSFNLLVGWAAGRYGLFGIDQEVPSNQVLNYVGVGLCALRAVIFMNVKSTVSAPPETKAEIVPIADTQTPVTKTRLTIEDLLGHDDGSINYQQSPVFTNGPPYLGEEIDKVAGTGSFVDDMSALSRRILGTVLAVSSGTCFGLNFIPVIYIKNRYPGASQDDLDYAFAHFCGIFFTSTVYFIIYAAYMQNEPQVYPKSILPALVSGVMWAIAQCGWFIANQCLTEAISFPIITAGPSLLAAFWGIVIFKEVKGWRNMVVLLLAFCVAVSGAVLVGISKGSS